MVYFQRPKLKMQHCSIKKRRILKTLSCEHILTLRRFPQTAKLVLDEYFESAGALEAMGAGSGDFFTLSQRPGAALLLRDDQALNGADDDVFDHHEHQGTDTAQPCAARNN